MGGRTFLGRYETVRLLGEGGMGCVYLAKQADLGRQVVVKVMHEHVANDPNYRERFQWEILLMARFQHPNVVALYDASLSDPLCPCIVMEYVRGISRKSDIKSGIVDLELRLENKNPNQRNLLHIVVRMRSPHPDRYWRERCYKVFCELRGYLAGTVISN